MESRRLIPRRGSSHRRHVVNPGVHGCAVGVEHESAEQQHGRCDDYADNSVRVTEEAADGEGQTDGGCT